MAANLVCHICGRLQGTWWMTQKMEAERRSEGETKAIKRLTELLKRTPKNKRRSRNSQITSVLETTYELCKKKFKTIKNQKTNMRNGWRVYKHSLIQIVVFFIFSFTLFYSIFISIYFVLFMLFCFALFLLCYFKHFILILFILYNFLSLFYCINII